jgi:hypothetical protein
MAVLASPASHALDLAASVADATFQPETNGGVGLLSFPVTLSGGAAQIPAGTQVTVIWSTGNGTATGGSSCGPGVDFLSQQQVGLTLSAAAPTGQINVPICGDALDEANETFNVIMSAGSGTFTIADGSAVGTIVDDDSAPSIRISNGAGNEGNSGVSQIPLTVTLSALSGRQVQASFAASTTSTTTATQSASCGGAADLPTGTGTVVVPPMALTGTALVNVCGDTAFEPDETFRVTLSNPQNASLATSSSAIATITNDDAAPANMTINDVTVTESLVSNKTVTFTISLSQALPVATSFSYRTSDGTAKSTGPGTGPWTCPLIDYFSKNGSTSIPANSLSTTISTTICGDQLSEGSETFFMDLSNAAGVAITDSRGVATIKNAAQLRLP